MSGHLPCCQERKATKRRTRANAPVVVTVGETECQSYLKRNAATHLLAEQCNVSVRIAYSMPFIKRYVAPFDIQQIVSMLAQLLIAGQ